MKGKFVGKFNFCEQRCFFSLFSFLLFVFHHLTCRSTTTVDDTRKAMKLARRAVSASTSAASRAEESSHYEGGGGGGGDDTRSSVHLFTKLRNEEVISECKRVEDFMKQEDKTRIERAVARAVGGVEQSPHVVYGDKKECKVEKLDFAKKFAHGGDRPVKLEVCSGHGDWIVSRAQDTADTTNWAAIEIRRDRIQLTWAKMLARNVDNILLLCGEAHHMMAKCVPPSSLSEVFVNYPDPPVWSGSRQRVLDNAFFTEAHRALKTGCPLTIVTDDAAYAKSAIMLLAKATDMFVSAFGKDKAYASELPNDYGTSYFDRMWKNGNRVQRYFIQYLKI